MSSKNISFVSIPSGLRKPGDYMEFNTRMAVNSLPANVQKVLLIGQRLTSGTVPALTPTQLFSSSDAADFFGAGSTLHLMAMAALNANPYLNLFAIANDDAGGSAPRQETITFTVGTLSAGTVVIWIGDQYVQFSYTSTDTPTSIALAIKNAINALTSLPFTAAVAAGVITLTAKNAGTVSGQIAFESGVTVGSGLTVAFAQTVPGTGDPDIHATGNVLDTITPEQFDIVASCYNTITILGYIKTYLNLVSGPIEERPGVCWAGLIDTVANAVSLGDGVNSGRICIAHLKGCRTPAFQIAAAVAAVDASLSDPAMPRSGMVVSSIATPPVQNRSTRTEQETLLSNGITPLEVADGEQVEIVRAVSSYITDTSLLDVTTIKTLDYTRLSIRSMMKTKYAQAKLRDATPTKIGTADAVKSDVYNVLLKLDDLDILENVEANKDGIIVERDLQTSGQLNAKIPADVVEGLSIFAGVIDLILQ
jgi:phage tail sheath gpL-like